MNETSRPPFHADQVGSLLRPQKLLEAREDFQGGKLDSAGFREIENEAIRGIVRMQENIGLEGVTDGEFRRGSFTHDFISRLDGVVFERIPEEETGTGDKRKRPPFRAVIKDRMKRPAEGIEVENFRFLNESTRRIAKLCIPSPTMLHFRGGRGAISEKAYPGMKEFFADLARIYREEVLALAEAGCRYLQFDDTNLAYLCSPAMRDGVRELGEDPDALPGIYASLINESIAGRPDDMAVTVHLCRGNASSSHFASGGYEQVADVMFNQTDVEGFFLEYDDERSGDFSPLRFVPPGKKIVLGLVSSKNPVLENPDVLKRRIDEASRYLPLEQLCLSPQCGFSSSIQGANKVDEEKEKEKLALVVSVAGDVWRG